MVDRDNPVWFITGCSSGFGRELAKEVLARGWRCVVTARDPKAVEDITHGHGANAIVARLDVTKRDEIDAAVQRGMHAFGRIDVLVNNAGYGYFAAVEEGGDAEVRALFEANVFGLIDVTKAVLPIMRAQKSGMVVMVSSIGGLTSQAATGYYHATKYAVEGLSESLAIEVKPLGIDVLIVEPGPFRTKWAGESIHRSEQQMDDYAATAGERRKASAARSGKQPGDPVRAARAIVDVAMSEKPPLRLLLGKLALENARKKIDLLKRDFDAMEATTLGADYPPGE